MSSTKEDTATPTDLVTAARERTTDGVAQHVSSAHDTIVRLADALEKANSALDYIATRVGPDDYDNPSSALEAIGDAVETTGRTIQGY